jgi:SAM-dependent methyltransferase
MDELPCSDQKKGFPEIMSNPLNNEARMLYCMEPLRKPVVQAIIDSLQLPQNSRGLDVGCGLGIQTQLLAQATRPTGQVTGMDFSPSNLIIARDLAQQAGMADRVFFQQGNWTEIPYLEGTFDWVWSMDAAGYAPYEPVAAIKQLAQVVRPGGKLIVAYWSSQCLLPGYPEVEAHLSASPVGIAPFQRSAPPENHYLRAIGWMQAAGLVQTRAETFVHTVSAPLTHEVRDALAELFAMRWGKAGQDVSPEVWQAYLRLCQPESPDYLPNCPDYCAFFTYSVFSGTIPVI